ncbi:MAG: lysine--tRNA ligase [Candidatus Dormibacteria bacterium]
MAGTEPATEAAGATDGGDLYRQRLAKLEALRDRGVEPFHGAFRRTHTAAEAHELFNRLAPSEGEEARTEAVTVAGRVVGHRMHGKAGFATIADQSGQVQVYARQDHLGEDPFSLFRELDLGDIVGGSGQVFRTRMGEVTVQLDSLTLLTKALGTLPEKWHGLKDSETRHRQRHLDMIANPSVRDLLVARATMVATLRRELEERGFVEVETPVLQPLYGGATARPFVTHYNALKSDFFLRIATELYLKRLLVGGMERVYEIGRCFRNEGLSPQHNPEFTVLECYQAYAGLEDMIELTTHLIRELAEALPEGLVREYEGRELDLSGEWRQADMATLVHEHTGVDPLAIPEAPALLAEARARGVVLPDGAAWGVVLNEMFEKLVEHHLWDPVFVMRHPVDTSPLARSDPQDPRFVERFELWLGGREIANAFGELTDPIEQRRRMEDVAARRAAGDLEAAPVDEDFIGALTHGMPPAGGLGIGIDRLVIVLTDQPSIREVIAFPQLRPRAD